MARVLDAVLVFADAQDRHLALDRNANQGLSHSPGLAGAPATPQDFKAGAAITEVGEYVGPVKDQGTQVIDYCVRSTSPQQVVRLDPLPPCLLLQQQRQDLLVRHIG